MSKQPDTHIYFKVKGEPIPTPEPPAWLLTAGWSVVETAELTRLRQIEAEAKAANLIGPDGKVRNVLGDLCLTADGAIATINGTFFTPPDELTAEDGVCGLAAWAEGNAPVGKRTGFRVSYIGTDRFWNSDDCYSTREAAEAARAKGEAQ